MCHIVLGDKCLWYSHTGCHLEDWPKTGIATQDCGARQSEPESCGNFQKESSANEALMSPIRYMLSLRQRTLVDVVHSSIGLLLNQADVVILYSISVSLIEWMQSL